MGSTARRGLDAGEAATAAASLTPAAAPVRLLRAGSPVVVGDQAVTAHDWVLSPSVVASLAPTVVTTGDAGGAPLAGSRVGSLFVDGGDPATSWYLPSYALQSPDPAFGFAAVQDGADAEGRPFNRGTVTVGLRRTVPADVSAAMQVDPTRTFREIPVESLDATLTLLTHADDGTPVRTTVPGAVTMTGPDTLTVTVDALLGPAVVVAFTALTATGGAELDLRAGYDQVRWQVLPGPRLDPPPEEVPPRRFPTHRPPVDEVLVSRLPRLPQLSPGMLRTDLVVDRLRGGTLGDAPLRLPGRRGPVVWGGRRRVAVREAAVEPYALPLALTYAGPGYRPLLTLTAGGRSAGIVSAQDLQEFDVHQSEYVELTSLGAVADRYPTLRALYLGQVSGTVLAIPAAYGVVRSQQGCAISCDAVVDTSPTSTGGCRFQLTFTVAPLVDAGDLARLTADLAADPTLAARHPRLSLPTDLDRRAASTLSSPSTTDLAFGVGLVPDTFTVSVTIADDDVPAVVKANLLLAQLSAPTATLLGRIAVRLDDAYEQTVMSDVVLSLRHTTGSDDVTLVVDTESGAVGLANASPLDLTVREVTSHAASGFTSAALDEPLPAAGALALDLPDGSDAAYVECDLTLPDSLPPGQLTRYVAIHAETVQQVHHVLGFNAAGQLDGIASVSITLVVDALPDLVVPTIVLSADHPVDTTAVEVPVAGALTGLPCTLALTVVPVGGGAPVQLSRTHEFGEHPVMVLTRDELVVA